jgi:hypothetical protein
MLAKWWWWTVTLLQGSPVAGGHKGCPVVGMGVIGAVEKVELGLSKGITASLVGKEAIVVLHHQVFGAVIADLPEAGELAGGSS